MRVHFCGVRGSTPAPGLQFVRYGAVGVSNTLLSAAMFAVGVTAGLEPVLAAAIAFGLGSINGFVWNRRWNHSVKSSEG